MGIQRNHFIFIMQFFLLIFQIFRLIVVDIPLSEFSLIISIISVLVSTILFFGFYEPNALAKEQLLRISYLFILGYLIVHFQIYMDYILGNYNKFRGDYLLFNNVVNRTAILSSIGLICFNLGYTFSLMKGGIIPSYRLSNNSRFNRIPLLLIVVSTFVLFIGTANKAYFFGGYGTVELGSLATYFQTYFVYGIFAYMIVKSYFLKMKILKSSFMDYVKNLGFLFNLIVATYLILVLTSGDRGPIIQLGLLYLSTYLFSQNKKLKIKYYVLGIFSAAFFITLLGQIRSFQNEGSFIEKYNQAKINKLSFENSGSFSPTTHELAISVRTVHAAVDYTDHFGFKYGIVQLNQLIAIFPGIGSIVRGITGLEGKDLISADILTHHIFGDNPSHGLGTSCLADFYLDFGMIGVVCCFFIFGFWCRYIENSTFQQKLPHLFIWILFFVFLTKSIYIGRSSITILFRESIVIYFFILISIKNFKLLKNA
ncbi:oligosaccharide repeat unit polymerase [Sphingobacteriaceae bacterium WQ 2009]|uniref:Oligosaccharide repeat unit polymerase n=1 Tax=Rhinopithecimicrobium faecis TaxID=2820698 RepID=A0A8T4H9N9_9SPHI|nr:oligosaccharide repeat unit polymerase [Sphingobacteriaceae bacterium WQ 2009]